MAIEPKCPYCTKAMIESGYTEEYDSYYCCYCEILIRIQPLDDPCTETVLDED